MESIVSVSRGSEMASRSSAPSICSGRMLRASASSRLMSLRMSSAGETWETSTTSMSNSRPRAAVIPAQVTLPDSTSLASARVSAFCPSGTAPTALRAAATSAGVTISLSWMNWMT